MNMISLCLQWLSTFKQTWTDSVALRVGLLHHERTSKILARIFSPRSQLEAVCDLWQCLHTNQAGEAELNPCHVRKTPCNLSYWIWMNMTCHYTKITMMSSSFHHLFCNALTDRKLCHFFICLLREPKVRYLPVLLKDYTIMSKWYLKWWHFDFFVGTSLHYF